MKRICATALLLLIFTQAYAQVGPAGYTVELDQLLTGHLSTVQSRARTTRLVTAGATAAVAATAMVGGTIMIIREQDPFYRMNGVIVTVGGAALGATSGWMFLRPSQAERDTEIFFSLPSGTESERIERFAIGESILRNLSTWSMTMRMAYGVAAGAIAATFFLNGGWLYGGVASAGTVAMIAIPGLPEREWRAYRRETECIDCVEE
jgi:hypothetical protein